MAGLGGVQNARGLNSLALGLRVDFLTFSAIGSFFSSLSSLLSGLAAAPPEAGVDVCTPCDVTSGLLFCSAPTPAVAAEGEGEGAPPVLLPALLKLEVVAVPEASVAEASSLPEASAFEPATEEGEEEEGSARPLSSASSLGLSPGPALGTPTDSRTGSVFELGCNLKSTLNFFRLSICFLWSGGMLGGPLLTVLVMLGDDSTGLTFSLLEVGEFCLASWTRGSLASADGVAARLEAGLAAMGDPVVMGVATESTGAMPV